MLRRSAFISLFVIAACVCGPLGASFGDGPQDGVHVYRSTRSIIALSYNAAGDLKVESEGSEGTTPAPPLHPGETCRPAHWGDSTYTGTVDGVSISRGDHRTLIPFPAESNGTHISAIAVVPEPGKTDTGSGSSPSCIWAAMFGDGIWSYGGAHWSKVSLDLPQAAWDVTALAVSGQKVAVGTRRNGVWERIDNLWHQSIAANEPVSGDCQAMAVYRDSLYVSTLEDGLALFENGHWTTVPPYSLSSNAPRDLVVSGNELYVRNGNGMVDLFDGTAWSKNVLAGKLPRKEASCLAAAGDTLLVGQWGGWSAFGPHGAEHHLDIADLQGVPVTSLLSGGTSDADLCIGTQGHVLAHMDSVLGKPVWFREQQGLSDDWITCLASGSTVYAGTFVGGLCHGTAGKAPWQASLARENVTCLLPAPNDNVYIGTRHGLWMMKDKSDSSDPPQLVVCSGVLGKDSEVQSMAAARQCLWIGTRTGIISIPWSAVCLT